MGLRGVLDAERSGRGEKEQEKEGKVWTARAGGAPSAQGCDRPWDQSSPLCPVQFRGLKLLCVRESRWWPGDIPKATDFFLEAVKVIDLSHDRLKGTKRFFQKEIKRLL